MIQTFSQLVDKMAVELHRQDMKAEIAAYLNQTVRECHFDPRSGGAIAYWANYKEEALTANVESAFSWDIPDVSLFQMVHAVRYDNIFVDGYAVYAKSRVPGPQLERECYAFCKLGNQILFKGYGGNGASISLSYFTFVESLVYYETLSERPASYDPLTGWTYPAGAATAETQEAARNAVTHWMLDRWTEVLAEGVRAKVYKRLSDTERSRSSYSLYQQLRQGLITSEQAESIQGHVG